MRGPRTRTATTRLSPAWGADAGGYVADLAASPDGRSVAVASVEGPVVVLDARSGETLRTLPGHGFGTAALSWSPDGTRLASAGQDGKVRLWDARTREEAGVLDGGAAWAERVAYAPDGRHLASAAGRRVRMWRPDGELLWGSEDLASTVSDLAWLPGRRGGLVASAYGGITLFDARGPEPRRRFGWKGSTLVVAPSPNGKYVATGDQDATVHFWITATGEDLQMWGYPTKVRELAWSPTSRFLATGGGPAVTVWDCAGKGPAGTRPLTLEAHEGFVTALAYGRKSPLLASGGEDGTVALWQPGAGARPLGLENAGAPVAKLAWTPDDRVLLAGCEDGSVLGYRVP